jgi:dTDP-4-dehydrorhamnose 3,5-epimerase
MEIKESGFEGLLIIEPKVFADSRGYFFESFNSEALKREGIDFKPLQDNESRSTRGVVRGLHYQLSPYAQAKLIRVVHGKIFDVGVDLRKNSSTFMKWFGMEIDSENKTQLLIPKGFAHGFSVLSEYAVIQYKVDNLYNKESERGIIYNDPELGIDWRLGKTVPVVSDKDRENRLLKEAEYNF